MIEQIKNIFKGYLIYFIIMLSLSFIASYFIFTPWLDKFVGINQKDFYIVLKKEKMDIKDEYVKNILNEKISSYETRTDELKSKIDEELEYKKTVLKNGLSYDNEAQLCSYVREFVKNSFLLEKYQLSEKYSKVQKDLKNCN